MPEDGRTILGASAFGQKREAIFERLKHSIEVCSLNYSGKKELATEQDDLVLELCEALQDTFSYGLRQQGNIIVTAASLFQNMQEIVIGSCNGNNENESTFWDFCQVHLTAHEKQRFEDLKNVWNKCGRGRAFIRAALNENALKRYILTWLSDSEILERFYTHWSLLLNTEICKELPTLIANLEKILFALTIDSTELNARTSSSTLPVHKSSEPIIYAPNPASLLNNGAKRKLNAVERPIDSKNSTEDLMAAMQEVTIQNIKPDTTVYCWEEEHAAVLINSITPTDPIDDELDFLKTPLTDDNTQIATEDFGSDDTSSQYSKSSSTSNTVTTQQLADTEQSLREMTERCTFLETRVAKLSLENRQLLRRLKQFFEATGIDPSSTVAGYNFLITIPRVQLMKKRSRTGTFNSYYAYEIHITMRQNMEHWSLWRRYRDFHKLHQNLLRTHPCVSSVDFPPKKHFGNMNRVFVEERRQQLQIYLLNLVETLPQAEVCKTKAELQRVFPFLRENL